MVSLALNSGGGEWQATALAYGHRAVQAGRCQGALGQVLAFQDPMAPEAKVRYACGREQGMANQEETTAVVIYTDSYRIDGRIALMPEARLTDFIRTVKDFVPVTDAVVYDKEGKRLFATSFLDVGRENIELIVPTSMMQK
jgi:hypothetical protein